MKITLFKEFTIPKKPFKRMDYKMAIEFLRENNITKEDNSFYEFGEVNLVDKFNSLFLILIFMFTIRIFQKWLKEK